MHMMIESAWNAPRCYTLYQEDYPEQEIIMSVVRQLWARSRDYAAVMENGSESNVPTILIESGTLAESFHDLWAQGKKIAIPLVGVEQFAGNDGATYFVEWSGVWISQARIKFWVHGPDEWQPLVEWIKQVIEACDNAIAASSPPNGDGTI